MSLKAEVPVGLGRWQYTCQSVESKCDPVAYVAGSPSCRWGKQHFVLVAANKSGLHLSYDGDKQLWIVEW